jgi:hypothetical protein
MMAPFQLGLDTFGDITVDGHGTLHAHAHTLRDVVSEAMRVDEVGIDAFGVGEHHRRDFPISAPEVVLAAIAGKTERLILGSAVTVLSTGLHSTDGAVRSAADAGDYRRQPAAVPTFVDLYYEALQRHGHAKLLDLSRFNLKYSNGTLPHEKLLRSIELFGTQVAPRLRALLQDAATSDSTH